MRNYRRSFGIWRDRSYLHPDAPVTPIPSAPAVAVAPEPIIEQVRHDVLTQTANNHQYRVVRLYESRDHGLSVEDIGATATWSAGVAIAKSETGRARVLEPWNKSKGRVVFDNLQPMETRA